MTRALGLVALTAAIALAAGLPAVASGDSTGTLNVSTQLPTGHWQTVSCPDGTTGANPYCFSVSGNGGVPGLGQTSESYSFVIDDYQSGSSNFHFTATIDVPGKGTMNVSGSTPSPSCTCSPYGVPLNFTITGGTGMYSGAQGSGTTLFDPDRSEWSGTLNVPGYEFDTTAPVISVKAPRTVRAPKGAKRVRVHYSAGALDNVDGAVPVKCTPKSGSKFKVGRTHVTCKATDSSANTATKRFTVTVKRRR
jgi:hypothetical protein